MADGSRVVEGGMELTELLEGMGLKDTFNAETVGGWVSEILAASRSSVRALRRTTSAAWSRAWKSAA